MRTEIFFTTMSCNCCYGLLRTVYYVLAKLLLNLSGERDDLHAKFSRSVLELQEKSSLKYAVLEKKILTIRKELVRSLNFNTAYIT